MLRIRLSMGGVRKRPIYKIVVADGRYPRDGKFIEKIGSYNPLLPKDKKERIKVEFERVKYWMSKGAQPTLRVSRILGEMELMPMPKPGNNPQKAIPKKDRKKTEGDKKEETTKDAPVAEGKKSEGCVPTLLVSAVARIDTDGKVLLAKRPKNKFMAGLWEFPGGKVEKNETLRGKYS